MGLMSESRVQTATAVHVDIFLGTDTTRTVRAGSKLNVHTNTMCTSSPCRPKSS